jgi:hypothetical protein
MQKLTEHRSYAHGTDVTNTLVSCRLQTLWSGRPVRNKGVTQFRFRIPDLGTSSPALCWILLLCLYFIRNLLNTCSRARTDWRPMIDRLRMNTEMENMRKEVVVDNLRYCLGMSVGTEKTMKCLSWNSRCKSRHSNP